MTPQEFDDLMENGDREMYDEFYDYIAYNHQDIHHFKIDAAMESGDFYEDFKDYYLAREAA
jgi:hypothetical protein